jgi:hypothetical protein
LGNYGLERAFGDALLQVERDYNRHLRALAVLDKLAKWEQSHRQALEQAQAASRARRESAWKQRCRELVGESLAEEAAAGGVPV